MQEILYFDDPNQSKGVEKLRNVRKA